MTKRLLLFLLPLAVLLSCEPKDEPELISIPLTVPENVVLHSATDNSLTFQWSPVYGATGYSWWLTCSSEDERHGSVITRNVTINGLSAGKEYSFRVCATAGSEVFECCDPVSASTTGSKPEGGLQRQCVDKPLLLTFDSVPMLGTSGMIKVFTSAGKEVDRIDLADIATVNIREDGVMLPKEQITSATKQNTFMDVLSCGGRTRTVHYTPLQVQGKTLVIRLHSNVLDFNTEYYVTVDESVCGKAIGAGEWKFATESSPSSSEIRVAADGTGDFCSLQRALGHAAAGAVITLAPGTYQELLYLRDKKDITVKGDSRNGVKIAYPNSENHMNGSSARCLWLVENCDNLMLENLTIENTFGEQKGQAETIYFNSGSNAHRLTIENCSLISYQDTFLCKGVVWVHNSLIAGHCDFIWGYPKACLFEDCEIRSRAAGYIVQARVQAASDKGFVFLNCSLTAEDGVKDGSMYLARSSGQAECWDNVTYVNCTMGPVIAPQGWYSSPAPNPSAPSAESGWKEFGSVTPSGVAISGHNAYGRVLTADEASAYSSRQAVLGF